MQKITASEKYTDEVLDWFKNEDAMRPRKLSKNKGFVWWKKGNTEGHVLPGAIPSLNHLLGTKYFPDPKNTILFLDIPEGHSMHEGQTIADVDTWLTDLDNAGVLRVLNGLVICRPYKYTTDMILELMLILATLTP